MTSTYSPCLSALGIQILPLHVQFPYSLEQCTNQPDGIPCSLNGNPGQCTNGQCVTYQPYQPSQCGPGYPSCPPGQQCMCDPRNSNYCICG